MNQIRHLLPDPDEVANVHAIMDRFPFPDFVTGYTVEFGAFDDEPSMWVRFTTNHRLPQGKAELLETGRQISELVENAHNYLREQFPDRYPYFRFADTESDEIKPV